MRSEAEQQVCENYLYQMGTRKKQVCQFSRGQSTIAPSADTIFASL